jgi:hypothetical protein
MTPENIARIRKRIADETKAGARLFSLKIEDAAWLAQQAAEAATKGGAS